MPLTVPHRLTAGRAAQTGERFSQALDELRRLGPAVPPVPGAEAPDQAFLEAQFLERAGRWNPDRWCPRMQPFGIRSVSPRPREILLRVPPEFLPDVIRAAMPHWLAEDEDGGQPEVAGIPGLRAGHEQGRGVLHRPGFPGRIAVAAPPGLWRKALAVAAAMSGQGGLIRLPWVTSPRDWHPCEAGYADAHPDDFSPAGACYRASGFASRILRRLPGLCGLPRADWHDLWITRMHGTPDIQFEWLNGPACAVALERLLDPEFGPGAELKPFDRQSARDCWSGGASRVRARAAGDDGGQLVLRRLAERDDGGTADLGGLLIRQHAERAAAEQEHGYRPRGGRLARSR